MRTLSAKALQRAIDAANEEQSRLCDEFISAGRGHELPSTTRRLSDPLAVKKNSAMSYMQNLIAEKEYRMQYHGSLKPVKLAN